MPDKPSYLGLLNTIARRESDAHKYLSAWADKTDNPDLEKVLRIIALREAEHALAFEKRLCELGYEVMNRPEPDFESRMEILSSDADDLEKLAFIGYKPGECPPDPFAKFFEDTTIDIQTSTLLGRYVAEERDSGRMLARCADELCRQAGRSVSASGAQISFEDICAEIGELKACIADLQESVATLVGGPRKKTNKQAEAQH